MHRRASHATFIHRRGFSTSHRGCAASHCVTGPLGLVLQVRALSSESVAICNLNVYVKSNTKRLFLVSVKAIVRKVISIMLLLTFYEEFALGNAVGSFVLNVRIAS